MSERHAPAIAPPAYAYVPGRFPHPYADPSGHRFGADLPAAVVPDPARWADSLHYVLGIDLFNHGYYWEAHELWESLWHACGRRGTLAAFFKGLIQLAVVGVKARQGRIEGVLAHARRARELFEEVAAARDGDQCMGMRLTDLIARANQILAQPPSAPDPAAAVEVVFPFQLELVLPENQGVNSASRDP
jgi:hypothetical protein